MIRVAVAGAAGRMGREVVRAIFSQGDMQLVAAYDTTCLGMDAGELAGIESCGVTLGAFDTESLRRELPHVLVDFTTAEGAVSRLRAAVENGVRVVSGTTGIVPVELDEFLSLAEERRVGVVYAPNFSIGAVLMMHFATLAARYFPHAEIIELHHDKKQDAPSGTAAMTAERIGRSRGALQEIEGRLLPAARGDVSRGVPIHSVRLPGLVAHQEVLFGGEGQVLTIRHDSFDRTSFMPGVVLAIRRVVDLDGPVVGLDRLLGL